jgi:hypothetical protein
MKTYLDFEENKKRYYEFTDKALRKCLFYSGDKIFDYMTEDEKKEFIELDNKLGKNFDFII